LEVVVRLQHRAFELFADYHQFYLWDRGSDPQAPEDYSEQDVERRIKTGPNVVVINPERNMTVAVELEIHDSEPPFHPDEWNHIGEASLHLPTGQLQVHECTVGRSPTLPSGRAGIGFARSTAGLTRLTSSVWTATISIARYFGLSRRPT
jgi:hypothetical protein